MVLGVRRRFIPLWLYIFLARWWWEKPDHPLFRLANRCPSAAESAALLEQHRRHAAEE